MYACDGAYDERPVGVDFVLRATGLLGAGVVVALTLLGGGMALLHGGRSGRAAAGRVGDVLAVTVRVVGPGARLNGSHLNIYIYNRSTKNEWGSELL